MQKNEDLRLPRPPVQKPHSVQIENREKLSLTGVISVESFNEVEVVASTYAGTVTVFGVGLHITRLDLDAGHLWVEGTVGGLEYHEQSAKKSLFSSLFR